ncbi:hypothetical protein RIF29_29897 [Crotalaria pallida]|uniref:Stress up-regulated Nod 19 protein n=1 Tax=Crotalaria pallida TaxID=3830 RepID=A0AAN9HWA1_CROPI
MRFISRLCILSSAILVLQLSTVYSLDQWKSATFLSPKFEVGPGSVARKKFLDIPFPKGHIAVKSVEAEVVDEVGKPVRLHEAYLDHWSIIKYIKHMYITGGMQIGEGGRPIQQPSTIFRRNSGPCNGELLPEFWGLGSETRGTSTKLPDPFGIEVGDSSQIPYPYEEKWKLDVMVIDMRGVEDRVGCMECRCDLYNVTNNLKPNYKGGSSCCHDNSQCRVRNGFVAPKKTLQLRYTVRWVDWNHFQVPAKVYILDVTDNVGKGITHNCQVEYDIQAKVGGACADVKNGSLSIETGGYVVYAVARQHLGGLGSTLYGQDGRVLCTSTPKYGRGRNVGNEKGYIVGMSTCYPHPGSVKINNGEILTLQSKYNNSMSRTGVVGQFYVLVADRLPH